jgi:hypothetical protein
MIQNRKDCSICVYNGACKGREHDLTITDCCIPEAPLREKQRQTNSVEQFVLVTESYISTQKRHSRYWTKFINNNSEDD